MEETISAFHRVFSLAGVPIFDKNNWDSKPRLNFQIFNFIIGLFAFVFTTGFVATNISDLFMFIQGACIWLTGAIMTITLSICLVFRRDFRNFLDEMAFKKISDIEVPQTNLTILELLLIEFTFIFKDNMLRLPFVEWVLNLEKGVKLMELKSLVEESQSNLLKHIRLILKAYLAIVWLCATLYLCTPIVQMVIVGDTNSRILAFDMWFPWGFEDFKIYVASFLFNAYCAGLCCIAYPALQTTIIFLIGQLIRQLRILTFILLHLDKLVTEITGKDERWQHCCTAIFVQCVRHYIALKRFSNKLNVICRPFYLALILDAMMLFCMCSVKIAISNKLSLDTMKYYIHISCFIFMVLIFCLIAQQVENECELLKQAVTEKWYIYNKAHKQNVLLFHMAVSQRMPIYIFGSITLSSPTFTWFLKTGMSFFTLMMSFLEEQG